ncbi:hypothetical protein BURMUCF2_A0244 [Burkholderia multivorans CF2]|nr:hypothetical protein BURMUCF2_A0244 [Burkholderia multivorans CF2]
MSLRNFVGRCACNGRLPDSAHDMRLKRPRRMLDEGKWCDATRTHAAVPDARASACMRPFVSPGLGRHRVIVRRSRRVRNCHLTRRRDCGFLCKRMQEAIA